MGSPKLLLALWDPGRIGKHTNRGFFSPCDLGSLRQGSVGLSEILRPRTEPVSTFPHGPEFHEDTVSFPKNPLPHVSLERAPGETHTRLRLSRHTAGRGPDSPVQALPSVALSDPTGLLALGRGKGELSSVFSLYVISVKPSLHVATCLNFCGWDFCIVKFFLNFCALFVLFRKTFPTLRVCTNVSPSFSEVLLEFTVYS